MHVQYSHQSPRIKEKVGFSQKKYAQPRRTPEWCCEIQRKSPLLPWLSASRNSNPVYS